MQRSFADEAAAYALVKELLDRQINNPCKHTGYESFVCEICGYPDPRKTIHALKEDKEHLDTLTFLLNKRFPTGSDYKVEDVLKENELLKKQISMLIDFIPDGLDMPLGYSTLVGQILNKRKTK